MVDAVDFRPDEGGVAPPPAQPKFDYAGAQQIFSDPKFLQEMAVLALQHNQKDGIAWLEKAHKAASENVFEALGHLDNGDGQSAIKAFNRSSGKFNDATEAVKNNDGTWTLSRKGGQSMTINPQTVMEGLLSPEQRVTLGERRADRKERSLERAETQEHRRRLEGLREREITNTDEYHKGMLGQREADAKQRGVQAGMRPGGGGGTRGRGSGASLGAKETQALFKDAHDMAEKRGLSGPEADAFAIDHVLRGTARLVEGKDGTFGIAGALPSGDFDVLAEFDTRAEAARALQDYLSGGGRPVNGAKRRGDPLSNATFNDPKVGHRAMETFEPPAVRSRRLPGVEPLDPMERLLGGYHGTGS